MSEYVQSVSFSRLEFVFAYPLAFVTVTKMLEDLAVRLRERYFLFYFVAAAAVCI